MKPFVAVFWLDAEGNPGWHTEKEVAKLEAPLVETRGYLIRKDKKIIVLAMTICDDHYMNLHVIPTGMVKKVTKL